MGREVVPADASDHAEEAAGDGRLPACTELSPLWSAPALRRSGLRVAAYACFLPALLGFYASQQGNSARIWLMAPGYLVLGLCLSHLEAFLLRRPRITPLGWLGAAALVTVAAASSTGYRSYLERVWRGSIQEATAGSLSDLLEVLSEPVFLRYLFCLAGALTLLTALRLRGVARFPQFAALSLAFFASHLLAIGLENISYYLDSPRLLLGFPIDALGWVLGFSLGDRWADRWGREPRTRAEALALEPPLAPPPEEALDTP